MPFQQAKNLVNALAFALDGQPAREAPFWHFTIVFEQSAGFDAADPRAYMARQGRALDQLGKWLRRRGLPTQYLWVREDGRYGQHTHLMLRLPAHLRHEAAAVIRRAAELHDLEDNAAVVVTPRRGEEGMHTAARCAGVLRDMLKGLSPKARVVGRLHVLTVLDIRPRACVIHGKRSGTSQSLGRAARKAAGWRDLSSLFALRAALPTAAETRRERMAEKRRRRRERKAAAGTAPSAPPPTRPKPDYNRLAAEAYAELGADFFEPDPSGGGV